jgi:hypothetical protein
MERKYGEDRDGAQPVHIVAVGERCRAACVRGRPRELQHFPRSSSDDDSATPGSYWEACVEVNGGQGWRFAFGRSDAQPTRRHSDDAARPEFWARTAPIVRAALDSAWTASKLGAISPAFTVAKPELPPGKVWLTGYGPPRTRIRRLIRTGAAAGRPPMLDPVVLRSDQHLMMENCAFV